jgi:hypothetical protein
MGMGDDCPTPGCGQLAAHPGLCRARLVEASQVGDTSDALTPLQSGGAVPLDRGQSEAKLACPTRNCRRTDEHDAKGCVTWKAERLAPGDIVGQWTLLERQPGTHRAPPRWKCRCSCGVERLVSANNLSGPRPTSRSCGCFKAQHSQATKPPSVAITPGVTLGRWTILARGESRIGAREAVWLARCECGTEREVRASSMRSGVSVGCGCYRSERVRETMTRHGHGSHHGSMSRSPTYLSWQAMRARCLSPGATGYKHYGGRGIRIHKRWLASFEAFLADMGERPPGMSIDRIDVNGHYEPRNCRWATDKQQAANKRGARLAGAQP